MALIRWNPTSELMNLHSEMDRIFNDMWQGFDLTPRATGDGGGTAGLLPLDIERTDSAVAVHAPVPGYSPEEVSVTVDSGVLTIEAQHQQQGSRGSGAGSAGSASPAACTARSPSARG